MPLVVGIAFRPVTKVYYFDPAGQEGLKPGERVVVETSRGRTLGQVVFEPKEVTASELTGALKPVVRRATPWDMVQQDQMNHDEPRSLEIAQQRSAALHMGIKIVRVEYTYDGSSAVVYFSSEQRVDFRNLVHDLSQHLRTRVEMRQVGVRDEAKFIGGLGKCGREFCCTSWLREFAPVSIKMAKNQDLPLNASEVSGVCGRLLCCLAYENDFYVEARKHMPRVNSMMETPQGPGKIRQVHVLANTVTLQVEGPNESRTYVTMPVPETVFNLNVVRPPEIGIEPGDTPLQASHGELASDDLPLAGEQVGAQDSQDAIGDVEAGDQAGRPRRSRRRKR